MIKDKYFRKYYAKNKKAFIKKQMERNAANPNQKLAQKKNHAKWVQKNKEHYNEYHREWQRLYRLKKQMIKLEKLKNGKN